MNKKRRKVLPTPQGNRTGPGPSPRPQVSEQDKEVIPLPKYYSMNWFKLTLEEFYRYVDLTKKNTITKNRGLSTAEKLELGSLVEKAKMPRQEALTRAAQFKEAAARHFEKPALAKLERGDQALFENFFLIFDNSIMSVWALDFASIGAGNKQILTDELVDVAGEIMKMWAKGLGHIEAWISRSFWQVLD